MHFSPNWLYIFWFLHQTTTCTLMECWCTELYIFWFLHQTTTYWRIRYIKLRCISFDSYIKPQLLISNIRRNDSCISFDSYIKPQRHGIHTATSLRCISFDSYIKPQPIMAWRLHRVCCISFDSYIKPQLSMHIYLRCRVVYLLIPTSNHNQHTDKHQPTQLYIFWFLHQTTTSNCSHNVQPRCISFDSYIKPQPLRDNQKLVKVVYLLIPTSNHNLRSLMTIKI